MLRESILIPLDNWRTGQPTMRELKRLVRAQSLSAEERGKIQLEKLRKLAAHAVRTTSFYRDRFLEHNVDPERLESVQDLLKLPPLTKDDLVGSQQQLVSTAFTGEQLHRAATGGSTGRHTPFYRNNDCLTVKTAAEFRFLTWLGWTPGEKILVYWPALQDVNAEPGWRDQVHNWLVRRKRIVPAGLSNQTTLGGHASELARYRPRYIKAFPNPLSQLARYLESDGKLVDGVRGVITMGEPLLEWQRQLFERVFRCPVFDCYVSRECGHIASECSQHEHLHIDADNLIVEFIEGSRPTDSGQPGEILVTDLNNFGMPFIRYRIGDMGIPLDRECNCGVTLPLMSMTAGRVSDFVVSPHDGSYVAGATLCHYLLALGPDVGQLQIIQDKPDHLKILMVKSDREVEQQRKHIKTTINRIFNGKMNFTLQQVTRIPSEPSGKYSFCKRLVDVGQGSSVTH